MKVKNKRSTGASVKYAMRQQPSQFLKDIMSHKADTIFEMNNQNL
jgi:hypothetical protein